MFRYSLLVVFSSLDCKDLKIVALTGTDAVISTIFDVDNTTKVNKTLRRSNLNKNIPTTMKLK